MNCTTLIGLQWRLRVVYSRTLPLLSVFRPKTVQLQVHPSDRLCFPLEFCNHMWCYQTTVAVLQGQEKKFDDNFICFNTMPACDRQTRDDSNSCAYAWRHTGKTEAFICVHCGLNVNVLVQCIRVSNALYQNSTYKVKWKIVVKSAHALNIVKIEWPYFYCIQVVIIFYSYFCVIYVFVGSN